MDCFLRLQKVLVGWRILYTYVNIIQQLLRVRREDEEKQM